MEIRKGSAVKLTNKLNKNELNQVVAIKAKISKSQLQDYLNDLNQQLSLLLPKQSANQITQIVENQLNSEIYENDYKDSGNIVNINKVKTKATINRSQFNATPQPVNSIKKDNLQQTKSDNQTQNDNIQSQQFLDANKLSQNQNQQLQEDGVTSFKSEEISSDLLVSSYQQDISRLQLYQGDEDPDLKYQQDLIIKHTLQTAKLNLSAMSSEETRNKFGIIKLKNNKGGFLGGNVLVNKVVNKLGGGLEGLTGISMHSNTGVEQIGSTMDKKYLLQAMSKGSFRNKNGSYIQEQNADQIQQQNQVRLQPRPLLYRRDSAQQKSQNYQSAMRKGSVQAGNQVDPNEVKPKPLRLDRVDMEKIYSSEQRKDDATKIKQFFEINPKMLKFADGMKLINRFVYDPSSIYQQQKMLKLNQNSRLQHVLELSYNSNQDRTKIPNLQKVPQLKLPSYQNQLPSQSNHFRYMSMPNSPINQYNYQNNTDNNKQYSHYWEQYRNLSPSKIVQQNKGLSPSKLNKSQEIQESFDFKQQYMKDKYGQIDDNDQNLLTTDLRMEKQKQKLLAKFYYQERPQKFCLSQNLAEEREIIRKELEKQNQKKQSAVKKLRDTREMMMSSDELRQRVEYSSRLDQAIKDIIHKQEEMQSYYQNQEEQSNQYADINNNVQSPHYQDDSYNSKIGNNSFRQGGPFQSPPPLNSNIFDMKIFKENLGYYDEFIQNVKDNHEKGVRNQFPLKMQNTSLDPSFYSSYAGTPNDNNQYLTSNNFYLKSGAFTGYRSSLGAATTNVSYNQGVGGEKENIQNFRQKANNSARMGSVDERGSVGTGQSNIDNIQNPNFRVQKQKMVVSVPTSPVAAAQNNLLIDSFNQMKKSNQQIDVSFSNQNHQASTFKNKSGRFSVQNNNREAVQQNLLYNTFQRNTYFQRHQNGDSAAFDLKSPVSQLQNSQLKLKKLKDYSKQREIQALKSGLDR
eukprot:403337790